MKALMRRREREISAEDSREIVKRIISGEIPLEGRLRKRELQRLKDEPCKIEDIIELIGGRTISLGQGASGEVVEICLDRDCQYKFAVKTVLYENPIITDPSDPVNVEVKILRMLNAMYYGKVMPNIPIYIGDAVCTVNRKKRRIIAVEKADTDFYDYMVNLLDSEISSYEKVELFRNIFFQVVVGLRLIQKTYPKFRHNDLHTGNVLIKKRNSRDPPLVYEVDGKLFSIDKGPLVLFWDFDYSSISGVVNNRRTEDFAGDIWSVNSVENNYVDLYRFFFHLNWDNFDDPILKDQLGEFLDDVVPSYYRRPRLPYIGKGHFIYNIEHTTPEILLNHQFFEPLRISEIDPNADYFSDQNISLVIHEEVDLPFKFSSEEEVSLIRCENYENIPYLIPKKGSIVDIKRTLNETLIQCDYDQGDIVNKMSRRNEKILMEWLEDVIDVKSKIKGADKSRILEITTRLLSLVMEHFDVPRKYLQLLGILCLNKATLYTHGIYFYVTGYIKHVTANAYEKNQINEMKIQLNAFLVREGIERRYLVNFRNKAPRSPWLNLRVTITGK